MPFLLISHTKRCGLEGQVRGVVDGCECCFIVKTSITSGVFLERSAMKTREIGNDLMISNHWLPIRMRIGQAPDLTGNEGEAMSFRGLLEKLLLGLTVGSSVEAEVMRVGYSTGKVFIRLQRISLPAVFRPTPVKAAEEKNSKTDEMKGNEGGSTVMENQEIEDNDPVWPAGLSRLWFLRSSCLKERGNWLLTNTNANHSAPYSPDRLESAFACYSRALQLVSPLTVSCRFPTKEGAEGLPEAELVVGRLEDENIEYFEVDHPKIPLQTDETPFRIDIMSLGKLHFTILSNMAQCQLKVGAYSYVVKQCTAALELAPIDDKELTLNTDEISRRDVEKAVFRRASAYVEMGLFDEAEEDLLRVLRLNPEKNEVTQKMLIRVRKTVAEMQAKMATRLKNAF